MSETPRRWTADDFDAQAKLCEDLNRPTMASLLRQGADAERRWEALKEGVEGIRAHWASFHSVAPSAVASVQDFIAQLERAE